MTKVEDISWGSYQEYEGPFYRGKVKFVLPINPTINDKRLAAITAVESGHYDAINMYDRMIVSVGLIQFGEANIYSVSKLLGVICESGLEGVVQKHLKRALQSSNATFKKNNKGIWKFFVDNVEVNNLSAQQKLFLCCDGRKGSWTDEKKLHAKTWAASIASVLEDPQTIEIQKKYTCDRFMGFVMADARKSLFDDKTSLPWADATRTIYLTFAINLPRIAGEMFSSTKFIGEKWSQEWCISLIKRLTFGPNIRIYPERYDAFRPVIERLYGIELPKKSKNLNEWKRSEPVVIVSEMPKLNNHLIDELNQIIISQNNPVISVKTGLIDSVKKFFSFFGIK